MGRGEAAALPMPRTPQQSLFELVLPPPHALSALVVALKAAAATTTTTGDYFGALGIDMLQGHRLCGDGGQFQG